MVLAAHANSGYLENDIGCEEAQCGGINGDRKAFSYNLSGKQEYKIMQTTDDFLELIGIKGYDNKQLLFLAGCNTDNLAKMLSLRVNGPVLGELMYGSNSIRSQYENGGGNPAYRIYVNGNIIKEFGNEKW